MEDAYVQLARKSLTAYTQRHEHIAVPDDVPAEMLNTRAACFVSLHEGGQLRGCIGTLAPTQSCLAEEIIANAISACSRDPRFPAVKPHELDLIECSVDVLSAPEPIESEAELDPVRYGVIVSNGWRRGVLLPDLEGVDDVATQVAIARRKAGIGRSEPIDLERFTVTRHV